MTSSQVTDCRALAVTEINLLTNFQLNNRYIATTVIIVIADVHLHNSCVRVFKLPLVAPIIVAIQGPINLQFFETFSY